VWYQKCQDLGWEHDVRIDDRFDWKAVYRAHFERCAPAILVWLILAKRITPQPATRSEPITYWIRPSCSYNPSQEGSASSQLEGAAVYG
jgi:hypothetical protein